VNRPRGGFALVGDEGGYALAWEGYHARFDRAGNPTTGAVTIPFAQTNTMTMTGLPALVGVSSGTWLALLDPYHRARTVRLRNFDRAGVLVGEADVGSPSWKSWPVFARRGPHVALAFRENGAVPHGIQLAQFTDDGRRVARDVVLGEPREAPGCGMADQLAIAATARGWSVAWSAALPREDPKSAPTYALVVADACAR
jgi:hypothetical protein